MDGGTGGLAQRGFLEGGGAVIALWLQNQAGARATFVALTQAARYRAAKSQSGKRLSISLGTTWHRSGEPTTSSSRIAIFFSLLVEIRSSRIQSFT